MGWQNIAPAEWAAHIKDIPSHVSVKMQTSYAKSAVGALIAASPLREPLLRNSKSLSGAQLDELIQGKRCNLESALIQIVGIVESQECSGCA